VFERGALSLIVAQRAETVSSERVGRRAEIPPDCRITILDG
jgi:hypothetical protein